MLNNDEKFMALALSTLVDVLCVCQRTGVLWQPKACPFVNAIFSLPSHIIQLRQVSFQKPDLLPLFIDKRIHYAHAKDNDCFQLKLSDQVIFTSKAFWCLNII